MRISPIKRYCDSTAWKHSKWIHKCSDSWKLRLASLFYRSIEKRSVTPQNINSVKLWNWLAYSERTRLKGLLAKNQPASANWCGHRFALMTPSYINGVAGEHDVNVLYFLSNLRSGWFWFFDVFTFLLYTTRKISLKWWALSAQRLYL